MKTDLSLFQAQIDRLDREVAMFHGVPLATFSDDAGVSAVEDAGCRSALTAPSKTSSPCTLSQA